MAPTGRALALLAAGAPLALLCALVRPDLWIVGPAWVGLVLAAMAFDLVVAPPVAAAKIALDVPRAVGVGDAFDLTASVTTSGRGKARGAALALSADPILAASGRIDASLQAQGNAIVGRMSLAAVQRGAARLTRAWVGWTGPLRLMRVQRGLPLDRQLMVVPSVRAVNEQAIPLFTTEALVGQRLAARIGEGSEFESLARFLPGFDRRAIDWKQSARHGDLLAKQFETERDNRVMLAIDCGRMMCGPVTAPDGSVESRLDRSISAALALGYVALRMDDRVSLSSFAGTPTVSPREYVRARDFAELRRASAAIDYRVEESNFTLGLASIAAALKRRSLVVIFTEFADAASAELMLRAVERLTSRHLVLFVVGTDSELESIAATPPESADALIGATLAADLLRDRRLVLARLRQLGAQVVEAPHHNLSAALLANYVRIKRRGML